jgi:hypothetical protein
MTIARRSSNAVMASCSQGSTTRSAT